MSVIRGYYSASPLLTQPFFEALENLRGESVVVTVRDFLAGNPHRFLFGVAAVALPLLLLFALLSVVLSFRSKPKSKSFEDSSLNDRRARAREILARGNIPVYVKQEGIAGETLVLAIPSGKTLAEVKALPKPSPKFKVTKETLATPLKTVYDILRADDGFLYLEVTTNTAKAPPASAKKSPAKSNKNKKR